MAVFALSLAKICSAQNTEKVSLESSESLFAVMAAINTCGYDAELGSADPLRLQIRREVESAAQGSELAKEARKTMCQFYSDRKQPEASRTLAQYVSLSLYLNAPPALNTKGKATELPPDATYVSEILPSLQLFYEKAGLHSIWERHQAAYAALSDQYHAPLAKAILDTEVYLKIPSQGYLGRGFTVYLEPLGASSQTNARNYGANYYVVISPGSSSSLKMEQIRHTYLHYLLDPLALKYPAAIKRIEPLLNNVKSAPMDEGFKNDIFLLTTECLIRAVEARTAGTGKTPESQREQLVEQSVQQGFVLTRYFFNDLAQFEKDPQGLRNAYGDMISRIDLGQQQKLAAQVKFAAAADPEVLHLTRPSERKLVLVAQGKLLQGDYDEAEKIAKQALDNKSEDQGRALFILAQVATARQDMEGARDYFQKALGVAEEPKVVAWSHIYLGRIFDLQDDRPGAVAQYQAALNSAASLPDVRAAAQRGIEKPYQPHSQSQ